MIKTIRLLCMFFPKVHIKLILIKLNVFVLQKNKRKNFDKYLQILEEVNSIIKTKLRVNLYLVKNANS